MNKNSDDGLLALLLVIFIVWWICFSSCVGWAPTREAIIRRAEASHLRNCVTGRCQWTKECIAESVERCQQQGMEATCGTDEILTETPIRCHPEQH